MRYAADVQPPSNALLALGHALRRAGYEFVTVTPQTHQCVNARSAHLGQLHAKSLRDVFGWSRPFQRELLSNEMFELLTAADALEHAPDGFRSRVRFSSLAGALFVHSAFPTVDADAVFFGPDTYRFCSLLQRWAPRAERAVDIGCGSGAGGIVLGDRTQRLVLTDVNARALNYAEVNAALATLSPQLVHSDILNDVQGSFDLIVANPPYMRDLAARAYRDGGGEYGEALSARIVREALPRLNAGGMLILYTGAPVVDGVDLFHQAVQPYLQDSALQVTYEQLDPDVFGDELTQPSYARVERIAAVGLRVCVSGER
jgi:release factor glutamine methyltransferase